MIRNATQHTRVQHTLLTDAWTTNVRTLETGIRDFGMPAGYTIDYRVSMFEVAGDPDLHVNITHSHETKPVKGWAGPGLTAAGFVHNRTFDSTSTESILHDIRQMVFAPRA